MITSSIQDILMMYVWEDDKDYVSRETIVEHAQPKLFDFPYPIYDDAMKDQFEKDFIRHFYTREIGSESIALFKLRLQDYLYLNHDKWQRLYQSIDNTVNPFANVDIKTTRSTDENESTDTNKNDDETTSGTSSKNGSRDFTNDTTTSKNGSRDFTNDTTTSETEGVTSSQDSTVDSHADDFTRSLEQIPPDERLNITAADGVGVIDYASQINENKNTNDSTQTTGTTGSSDTDKSGSENTTHSGTSTESGSDNTTHSGTTTESGQDSRERTRTELENQLRSFEQALDEHKIGRNLNRSFVELYDEYIQHFQGLHRLMFKDMEKLFLGVF